MGALSGAAVISPTNWNLAVAGLELFLLDIYGSERSEPQAAGTTNYENVKAAQFDAFQRYLKAHIHLQLSLEQISNALSMSPSALNKLCQEQCGCSPMACFIQLKIRLAKQMISQSTMNFTQIAEKLGYASVHYFSKQFKKETGKSVLSLTEFTQTE